MTTYQSQREAAFQLGLADGRAVSADKAAGRWTPGEPSPHLQSATTVAEKVGYELPAPTSDGYPYDLARVYLDGFTTGRIVPERKAS